ncbi:MAG: DNA polymerase III subunit gamma/tau [Berryella intestinalis]|uniref:DNA polymerase III subunit gamma/tau n=1 Tax=Berryella intestinalis TaxID=1531429 RepID=UPI002A75AE30|nr:DNA polymerase III subunit gamma/tau [Berryella intestinalis]MDY3128897.1 DNA polymerase III subunit gamma/tau [Berryella intestinalis]
MAESLYRKYRPQVFSDVVGQEHIERTIKNAIEQGKVSHAYLFTGPRGTGKTTTARLVAKALLCESGPTPEPDGTCSECRLISEGAHPDVYELDAASRTGVENVREEIISRVQFAPTRGGYKVYIVDEVHMLSTAAFNALLKTLEEPPSHVVFILCTTDPQRVPETIHSRCQRFDFRRIAPESIVARLGAVCTAEGVGFEGEALELIARRAEGGLRNALTSLEQIIAFENGAVTLAGAERLLGSIDSNEMAELMTAVGTRDVAACFSWVAEYVETGADLAQFARDMAERVRNMYIMSLAGADVELDVADSERGELVRELEMFGSDRLARLMGVLGDLTVELKTSSNPRLSFEIALTRMVRPDSDLTMAALAERIEALESGYSAVAHVTSAAPARAVAEPAAPMQVAPAAAAPEPQAMRLEPPAVPTPSPSPARSEPALAQTAQAAMPAAPAASPVAEPATPPETAAAFAAPSADPASAPVSAAPTAAAGRLSEQTRAILANPASLQRLWQSVLSDVKKQKAAYGVLFMNTKALFDPDRDMVLIQFGAEAAFAYGAVQKPEVQEAVDASFAKNAGGFVPYGFVQAGGRAAPAASVSSEGASVQPTVTTAAAVRAAASSAVARVQEVREAARARAASAAQGGAAAGSAASAASADRAPLASPPVPEAPAYEPVPYDEVPYDDVAYFAGEDEYPASPAPAPAPAPAADGEPNDISNVERMMRGAFGGSVSFTELS